MYEKAKEHFIKSVEKSTPELQVLLRHLPLVEKWARKLLTMYPEANSEVVLLSVWLHDIGNVVGDPSLDHAINSENETHRFLTELGASKELIDQVAHCVRSHRRKDVLPETLEAQIVTASDSASHMLDIIYIDMFRLGEYDRAMGKLSRDYRDLGVFPDLQQELKPFYDAWVSLLEKYPRF